ncbi:hypothetical protein SUGI_0643700 [Cryptomeria japonica]|nr:hypothetical protein SUGI_0643700 [Cryptomeria japonica]
MPEEGDFSGSQSKVQEHEEVEADGDCSEFVEEVELQVVINLNKSSVKAITSIEKMVVCINGLQLNDNKLESKLEEADRSKEVEPIEEQLMLKVEDWFAPRNVEVKVMAEFALNKDSFEANIRHYPKLLDTFAKEDCLEDIERLLHIKLVEATTLRLGMKPKRWSKPC